MVHMYGTRLLLQEPILCRLQAQSDSSLVLNLLPRNLISGLSDCVAETAVDLLMSLLISVAVRLADLILVLCPLRPHTSEILQLLDRLAVDAREPSAQQLMAVSGLQAASQASLA